MLDVVISIVTYNSSNIIRETIKSIVDNTADASYRVVIYDNCSTDNTLDIIDSMKLSNVAVIKSNTNHGFGFGHNRIIESYEAKYYLIYNPDLRVKNNIIKELFNYMESHHDVGMVTPKIEYQNGKIQYLCKQNPTIFDMFVRRFLPKFLKKKFQKREDWFQMKYTNYDKEFAIPYATGCFMFFRSNIIKNIKGFDERYFLHMEDADISRKTNSISVCMFYPYNSVTHLWARGSHTSIKQTFITIQSAVYYFHKWGWKFY